MTIYSHGGLSGMIERKIKLGPRLCYGAWGRCLAWYDTRLGTESARAREAVGSKWPQKP